MLQFLYNFKLFLLQEDKEKIATLIAETLHSGSLMRQSSCSATQSSLVLPTAPPTLS